MIMHGVCAGSTQEVAHRTAQGSSRPMLILMLMLMGEYIIYTCLVLFMHSQEIMNTGYSLRQ